MKRARCLLMIALTAAAQPGLTTVAHAQTQVETEVTAQVVELGAPFRVQVKASGAEQPSNPRLKVPSGFAVNGPSVGTSQQMSITNGGISRTIGLTATWQLTPSKLGTFSLGPAQVTTPQGPVRGQVFQIKVVPKGQAPRPAPKRRRSIFDDPLSGLGPGRSLFGDLFQNPGLSGQPQAPFEYRIDQAPDDVAFLRAEVDKKRVVIGEQLTLKVYGYGGRGRFNENDPSEPRRPNFYSFPIVERSGKEPVYVTSVGEQRFHVAKLRELALFPLATGRQEIGQMTIKFYGSRYVTRLSPEGLERKSQALVVDVVEPPVNGRPTGYRVGDVGNFRLNATVSPSKLESGGSAAVVATLKGIGNLPAQLLTPEQHGVEWLSPTVNGELQILKGGRIGGTRTFNYVVRIDKTGRVDLGELSLPYYNPKSKRYRVARAKLGSIDVSESRDSDLAAKTDEPAKLSAEAEVRRVQSTYIPSDSRMSDQSWFWLLAFGAPFGVFTLQTALESARRLGRKRRGQAESLERKIRDCLDAARTAERSGDTASLVAEVERAVFLQIEVSCGLRARAILKHQLAGKLIEAGLQDDDAKALVELLDETESRRFGGGDGDSQGLLVRVQKLLKRLPGRTKKEPA